MSGAVEALRHLELMALNTAQTASAASKVNECVALLTASRTAPPARSYADGVAEERARLIKLARQNLALTQGCMECNAEDERRWADTIRWLEENA